MRVLASLFGLPVVIVKLEGRLATVHDLGHPEQFTVPLDELSGVVAIPTTSLSA